jgi:PhnB protein
MRVEPYLNFDGRCEEAIEFYKKSTGAQVTSLIRFNDAPPGACAENSPKETRNKVMHARLKIGDSTIMASDCDCKGQANFRGISLSLTARSDAEAERLFTALSEGGKVAVPLGKTFFSSSFGVTNDRFGVTWMIVVMP